MAKNKAEIARETYRDQYGPVTQGCTTCDHYCFGTWGDSRPGRRCDFNDEPVSYYGICDCWEATDGSDKE